MNAISLNVNYKVLRDDFLNSHLPNAILSLKEDTQALWGKMTPQQMVEHLIWSLKLSNGLTFVPCVLPTHLANRSKSFINNNQQTPHGFMNPYLKDGLPPLEHTSLQEARTSLLEQIRIFIRQYSESPDSIRVHPRFGELNLEEWSRVHFKHSYHHLLQFVLIKEE